MNGTCLFIIFELLLACLQFSLLGRQLIKSQFELLPVAHYLCFKVLDLGLYVDLSGRILLLTGALIILMALRYIFTIAGFGWRLNLLLFHNLHDVQLFLDSTQLLLKRLVIFLQTLNLILTMFNLAFKSLFLQSNQLQLLLQLCHLSLS